MRMVVAGLLFAVFALVAFGNSIGAWLVLRRKRAEGTEGGVSLVPVIGGVAGALACVIVPGFTRWAWAPLLADVGCAPLLIVAAIAALRKK